MSLNLLILESKKKNVIFFIPQNTFGFFFPLWQNTQYIWNVNKTRLFRVSFG